MAISGIDYPPPTDFPDALVQVILISSSQNDFKYLKYFSSQLSHTTLVINGSLQSLK